MSCWALFKRTICLIGNVQEKKKDYFLPKRPYTIAHISASRSFPDTDENELTPSCKTLRATDKSLLVVNSHSA